MILLIVCVLLGIVCGRFFLMDAAPAQLDLLITIAIAVVVFSAGVDVGAKKILLRKLREHQAKILLIPLGTIIGSLLGGCLLGLILGVPLNQAAAISAGFGYYSLSAGILTGLGGAGLGALAFVANIFRELLALLITPFVAKYVSPYSAVAPGGATSMDTTLGIIARSTNEEITMMAMIHGIILTVIVPLLVPFLYRLG